jgi:hypothetical protein
MTATILGRKFEARNSQAVAAVMVAGIKAVVAILEGVIPAAEATPAVEVTQEEAIPAVVIRAAVIRAVVAEVAGGILAKTSKIIQKWSHFFACPVRSVST